MAHIKISNPPPRRRHRARKRKHAKAVRRFKRRVHKHKRVRAVRKIKVARRKRRTRRTKSFGTGRHRPVIKVKRGRIYRPRRSHISPFARFSNPFGGELAILGNPHKKRRKHSMAKRRHRRHHRRHLLSNPVGSLMAKPREMLSKDTLVDGALLAGGFILPDMALNYVPAQFHDTTIKKYVAKAVAVAGISVAAGFISKRASRMVLLGGVASILLDAWSEFRIGGSSTPKGTGTYYGNLSGTDTYYGNLGDGDF